MTAAGQPIIESISWGEVVVHLPGEVVPHKFKDCILFPTGAVEWDWKETNMHHFPGIRRQDLGVYLLGPTMETVDVVVLTSGYEGKLFASEAVYSELCPRGIGIYRAPTKYAKELITCSARASACAP